MLLALMRKSTSSRSPMSTKTFALQDNLQRLPIPPLKETIQRYLASVKPLVRNDDEWVNVQQAAKEFLKPHGQGEILQERLLEYERLQKNSWLEVIWLAKAYHEWRESSMINSNWFMMLKDHPHKPLPTKVERGIFTPVQIFRAASITHHALQFYTQIVNEELPVETQRDGKPLCMNQLRCMYGYNRIPAFPGDRFAHLQTSDHIVVLIQDQMYKFPVLDKGHPLSISTIERSLFNLLELHQSRKEKFAAVGLLTSEHRDKWAKAYSEMIVSPVNRSTFEIINDALFCLSLDDYSAASTSLDDSLGQFFHGYDARNRWFDKALLFIVANNGRAGLNGEHSPCDAVIPGRILDYIVDQEAGSVPNLDVEQKIVTSLPLTWDITPNIKATIDQAAEAAKLLINDNYTTVLWHKGVGGDLLKSLKLSPDAFVQMAMQLTYFKLHKRFVATYETASTRAYKHGRTECVRTLSEASVTFVNTAVNSSASNIEKLDSLKKAIDSHVSYMKAASNGLGCDRHMLGLRCMLRHGEQSPTIFTDPLYGRSATFELSTSNISPARAQQCLGFGPVVDTGYGINYGIDRQHIRFAISAKRSAAPYADADRFRETLASTLDEMAGWGQTAKL